MDSFIDFTYANDFIEWKVESNVRGKKKKKKKLEMFPLYTQRAQVIFV